MHVYHYAPYEPSAFKRLMGRYATRERALDRMLARGRFVDLYAVVRRGSWGGRALLDQEPRAAVRFERSTRWGSRRARTLLEHDLDLGRLRPTRADVREAVLGYKPRRLRCGAAAARLARRAAVGGHRVGRDVRWPVVDDASRPRTSGSGERRVLELRGRLLAGVPRHAAIGRTSSRRVVLAYLLDFHRREDKAVFWEFYRLRDLPVEDLAEEPQAITDLVFIERLGAFISPKTGKPTSSVIDRYRYPPQEMEIRESTS
jgi:uncharacterized protein